MELNKQGEVSLNELEDIEVPDREWDFSIPFTNGNKWVEILLEHNKILTVTLKELYKVPEKYQGTLELEDERTFFEIMFRIPFRKEIY